MYEVKRVYIAYKKIALLFWISELLPFGEILMTFWLP